MSDSLSQLGYLAIATRFRRIMEKLYVDGDKIYKRSGFNFKASWFSVYYVLAKAREPLSVMEVANQIDFSHITVKNIVKELENASLVKVEINAHDRRSKKISLSDQGRSMLSELEPLWLTFSNALKVAFTAGHPDFINILNRIDGEIEKISLEDRVLHISVENISVLDYSPSLRHHFYELAGNWLLDLLDGSLEDEDQYVLKNPDEAYLAKGGFLFFAKYKNEIVGCVALKRLDDFSFEFAKLFINPEYRGLGIATKLIERCITRCKENEARELWLQTIMSLKSAHKLYDKLGFKDQKAPPQMDVLERTEKIMFLEL